MLYLSARSYRRRLRPGYRQVKQLESSALAVVQEVLDSLRVVKAFGQEDREHERFVSERFARVCRHDCACTVRGPVSVC